MRPARSPLVESGGDAERDVLGDRQRLEQREVLEHHADAELRAPPPGLCGLVGPAGEAHRARVGPHDAVDHLHQGRLAGAVLAEQRMDLACADGEATLVVGHDRRKRLGDAGELKQRLPACLCRWSFACGHLFGNLHQLGGNRNGNHRRLLAGEAACRSARSAGRCRGRQCRRRPAGG